MIFGQSIGAVKMIDIKKLLARCGFHIGRGENMTIDPVELKLALQQSTAVAADAIAAAKAAKGGK